MEAVIKKTLNQSLLQLPKTAKSMEGWYQCIAENEAGEEYSLSTLHVLGLFFGFFMNFVYNSDHFLFFLFFL